MTLIKIGYPQNEDDLEIILIFFDLNPNKMSKGFLYDLNTRKKIGNLLSTMCDKSSLFVFIRELLI